MKIAVIDDGIDSAYINPIIVESLEVRNKCVIHCSEVRGITHGTKCAKVLWLAAETDSFELVSIKILKDSTDRGEIDDLVIALEWCYNNKIKLINLSAGSNRYIDKIKLLPVVKKISEKGIIVAACNNSNTLTYPASLNGVIGVKCDKSEIIPAGNYFYNSNDIRNVEVTVGSISDIPKFSELDLEKHNSFVAPYITGIISKMLLNGKEIGEIQKRLVDGSIAFNCTFNFEECNMNKAFFANPFIIALKSNRELDLGKLVIGLRKEGYEATAITYNSYSGKRDEEFCFEYWVNMFDITMEDARQGSFSIIIVKDFSRFGRDHLEVGNFLERILPVLQIRFISVNDSFDSMECRGMTGGMSVALKNILNSMYSRDLSVKVRTAMDTRASKGEYVSSFAAYGYCKNPEDKHQLVPDPEAAEIVRLIFTMAAEGKTKSEITRYLNENHVTTPIEHIRKNGVNKKVYHEKGIKLWTTTSIGDMLKNEVYLGKTIWNKSSRPHVGAKRQIKNDRSEWQIVEGTHEPIVSQELFDRANEKAFTHIPKKIVKNRKLSPLLFCPHCDRYMSFGGGRHLNYRCSQASKTGIKECAESKINRELLENLILTCTKEMINFLSADLERRKKQWSESKRLAEEAETLQNEKARLSARKFTIYDDYRSGNSSREKYLHDLKQIQERLAEIGILIPGLEQQIKEADKKMEGVNETENNLADIAALQSFDKETLSKVIERVYVYGADRVEIIWKTDDIFFSEEMPEKRKVINPAEMPLTNETPAGA